MTDRATIGGVEEDGFDSDEVERWFVHRGVPQAIFHYNAAEDVLTRMVPYLAAIFLLGALAGFGDQFKGWAQFGVAVAAVAILTALAVGVNRLRGRRPFELPDDVRGLEVALFLFGAPLIAVLFGNDRTLLPIELFGVNIAMLVLGYVVTTYGLVPMFEWGLREVAVQLRGLIVLLARSLPLLLLFATFLFLNAEMWQVAHDLTPALFAVVIAMVLVPAFAFLALRLPGEIETMHQFETWVEIDVICAGTDAPVPAHTHNDTSVPDLVPLDDGERRNLSLLMIIAQVVQIVLVAFVIGAFFVVFGLATVREATILQWTAIESGSFDPLARFTVFSTEMVLTWELFAVSGFIASISALQFAVSLISDELYRKEFFASIETEIREVLAVRARYLEPLVVRALGDGTELLPLTEPGLPPP